jgi:hypothetical protein
VCEVETLHKQVLQTKVSVRDAPFMEVSDSTHQLLEEKSRQAFLEGTLTVPMAAYSCTMPSVLLLKNTCTAICSCKGYHQTCEMSFSGVENLLSPVWYTQCREGVCVCRIVW